MRCAGPPGGRAAQRVGRPLARPMLPERPVCEQATTSSRAVDNEPSGDDPAISPPPTRPLARDRSRLKTALFGKARDLHDRRIFHTISLIPFLAWVGLGADGLSSSAYGPEEAFKTIGVHKYLA